MPLVAVEVKGGGGAASSSLRLRDSALSIAQLRSEVASALRVVPSALQSLSYRIHDGTQAPLRSDADCAELLRCARAAPRGQQVAVVASMVSPAAVGDPMDVEEEEEEEVEPPSPPSEVELSPPSVSPPSSPELPQFRPQQQQQPQRQMDLSSLMGQMMPMVSQMLSQPNNPLSGMMQQMLGGAPQQPAAATTAPLSAGALQGATAPANNSPMPAQEAADSSLRAALGSVCPQAHLGGKYVCRVLQQSPDEFEEVEAGATFIKHWRLRNDGSEAWPEETSVRPILGAALHLGTPCLPHSVAPGGEVAVKCKMRAPVTPGAHLAYYELRLPSEEAIGYRLECHVVVAAK